MGDVQVDAECLRNVRYVSRKRVGIQTKVRLSMREVVRTASEDLFEPVVLSWEGW